MHGSVAIEQGFGQFREAIRPHIDDEGLQSQGDAYFVTESEPETPDPLPIPPAPELDFAQNSPTLKYLKIDVLFKSLLPVEVGLDVLQDGAEVSGSKSRNPVPKEDLDGYDWGYRFLFDDISNAHQITAVSLSRNQVISTDVKYRIVVRGGNLFSDSNQLSMLKGQVIASNREIKSDNENQTFTIPWRPAADFASESTEEYKKARLARQKALAIIAMRKSAHRALVENIGRFEKRLQRLILRRRHFFTRVILNAIEPEEISQLLEGLWIQFGVLAPFAFEFSGTIQLGVIKLEANA